MPARSDLRASPPGPGLSDGRVEVFLRDGARAVDAELDRLLPAPAQEDGGVPAAMRYTALAPGKRIRPLLTLAVADLYGVPRSDSLPPACAIEMVHACSLILDDLPCMDDADLRRGLPANHRAHGEATAILAAFALLNRAYGLLAGTAGAEEPARSEVGRCLSRALGTEGVIGGQALDLAADAARADLDRLERIHSRKTGSLFIASVEVGAILGRAPLPERAALVAFAKNLGLAYQILDDWLDATGSSRTLGKPAGKDRRGSFVTLAGADGARRLADDLVGCALDHLRPLGTRASLVAGLAVEISRRSL
jgi:geranylgeranyl pyrophosphate synthase